MRLDHPGVLFVRGSARSGTTLLSDILNENPKIGILVEQPLGDLAYRMRDIFWFERHRDEQRETIAAMRKRRQRGRSDEHYAPIENPERMRFPRRYPMCDRFPHILTAVVEASLEKPGLEVVGSKTPGHWNDHELRAVADMFACVRSVFIVRNPLETINSIVNRRNAAREGQDLWPDKPIEEAISRYREGICLLLSCAADDPENTYVVRYDDLIGDAARTLAGLGDFLGIELSDSSGLVREARLARNVLTKKEERLVREELGGAIDAWPQKRLTGIASQIGRQLDDCVAVAGNREFRFDAPVGERGVLGSGWSGAEPDGIWSDAASSDVFFAVPRDGDYVVGLRLAAFVADRREPLQFRTSLAGHTWHHTMRNGRSAAIALGPVPLSAGGAYRLQFTFDRLASLPERETGGDPRRKGVRLRRLKLRLR